MTLDETLARTLAALEGQTYPRNLFEVLIIDDGSEPPLSRPSQPPTVESVQCLIMSNSFRARYLRVACRRWTYLFQSSWVLGRGCRFVGWKPASLAAPRRTASCTGTICSGSVGVITWRTCRRSTPTRSRGPATWLAWPPSARWCIWPMEVRGFGRCSAPTTCGTWVPGNPRRARRPVRPIDAVRSWRRRPANAAASGRPVTRTGARSEARPACARSRRAVRWSCGPREPPPPPG